MKHIFSSRFFLLVVTNASLAQQNTFQDSVITPARSGIKIGALLNSKLEQLQ